VVEHIEIQRLVGSLESVLVRLVDKAGAKLVSDIDVTGRYDLEDVWTWNSPVLEMKPSCLHLIIERSHTQSSSIVVEAWDSQINYNQLHQLFSKLLSTIIVIKS
jgi:hypothetical protein